MPQAIPTIVGALKLIGGGTLINGAVVGGSALLGAFQVGLAVATQFLGSKPKKQGATARRDNTLMVRESAFPRREIYGRARVGGIWFYAQTGNTNNNKLYLVLGICDGAIDAVETVLFGEKPLQLDAYGQFAGEYAGFGEVDFVINSFSRPSDILAFDVDAWTTNHKLRGIAYAVFKITHDATLFANGLPEISFIVRGRKDIYDPRTDTTGYSSNPALCLNHFLTVSKWGAGADYATEINEASLIAAANVCDETVTTLEGVESRYTCNGSISSDTSIEDNMGLIRQCMAGTVVYTGGRFKISAGAYSAPTFAITPDHILNVEKHTTKKPRRERVNTVKGLYTAEINKWQESDFPTISNAAYIAADGGDTLDRDLELALVQSPAMAQRLAKIELETSRLERTLELECSLRVLPVVAGSVVSITFPRYGYTAKTFQCIASEIRPGSGTNPPTIKLSLREWNAGIYAWDSATEEKTANPTANIPGGGLALPETVAQVRTYTYTGNELIFNTAPTSLLNYIPLFYEPANFDRFDIALTNSETASGAEIYYKLTYDNYGSDLLSSTEGTLYTGNISISQFRSWHLQILTIKDGMETNLQKLRLEDKS